MKNGWREEDRWDNWTDEEMTREYGPKLVVNANGSLGKRLLARCRVNRWTTVWHGSASQTTGVLRVEIYDK